MAKLIETKAELLEQMQQARTELEQALAPLSEEQMTRFADHAGWSIQDHLDHLAVWQEGIATLLERRPGTDRFAAMGVDRDTARNADQDQMNAIIRERTPARSLAETRAALRASHRHLLAALDALNDADLMRTYSYYQPGWRDEDDRTPIIAWVVGNSSEHFREHLAWMRPIAAQGRSG